MNPPRSTHVEIVSQIPSKEGRKYQEAMRNPVVQEQCLVSSSLAQLFLFSFCFYVQIVSRAATSKVLCPVYCRQFVVHPCICLQSLACKPQPVAQIACSLRSVFPGSQPWWMNQMSPAPYRTSSIWGRCPERRKEEAIKSQRLPELRKWKMVYWTSSLWGRCPERRKEEAIKRQRLDWQRLAEWGKWRKISVFFKA